MKKFNLSQINKTTLLTLILFLVSFFLYYNEFFPTLREINKWDEAIYINSGRKFAQGQFPIFSQNPLVALLYMVTYLPFRSSPHWMVNSTAFGRIILFTLMWFSGYSAAKQIIPGKRYPYIYIGIISIFPTIIQIFVNPSDALFASMSGFALWQLLIFHKDKNNKNLALSSLFVGLAALSRNDGLIMFIVLILVSILIDRDIQKIRNKLIASITPFIVIVGGYLLIYGLVTGNFSMGTTDRTYVAFEQAHVINYDNDGTCELKLLTCAVLQSREIYGTAEENDDSVLRAIARNPGAFFKRVLSAIKNVLPLLYRTYGTRTSTFIFMFAFLGIIDLLRRKEYKLLGILVVWPVYLGTYLLTYYRAGYLQTPFIILYTLTSLGIYGCFEYIKNKKPFLILSSALITAVVIGVFTDTRILYFTSALVLFAILLTYLYDTLEDSSPHTQPFLTIGILFTALILHPGTYGPPVAHPRGLIAEEEAIVVMQETLPENAFVGAGAPGTVWAANMDYVPIFNKDFYFETPEAYYQKMLESGIQAIYIDHLITNINAHTWELIEPGIDLYYEQIYMGRNGSIRVLLVNQP